MAKAAGSCVDCGVPISGDSKPGPNKLRCLQHEVLARNKASRDRRYATKPRRNQCIVCETPFDTTSGRVGKPRRVSTRKTICDRKSCGREYYWLQRLQIPFGTYESLYLKQKGQCALCGKSYENLLADECVNPHNALLIDHCHVTMKIRGLLCRGCNGAIGQLGDDRAGVERALVYLTQA